VNNVDESYGGRPWAVRFLFLTFWPSMNWESASSSRITRACASTHFYILLCVVHAALHLPHRGNNRSFFGENMKALPGFLVLVLIVGVMGCSGNDKDRATQPTGSMPSFANTTAGAEGAGAVSGDQKMETSAASSGGSSLQASTPYSSGKSSTVSQNLNPAPFLTAAGAKAGAPNIASATGLVSRADGTMYGPSDLAAAGVGPGMSGAAETGANRSSNAGKAGAKTGLSAPAKPASNQTSGK
jgi:hypothetical protein